MLAIYKQIANNDKGYILVFNIFFCYGHLYCGSGSPMLDNSLAAGVTDPTSSLPQVSDIFIFSGETPDTTNPMARVI